MERLSSKRVDSQNRPEKIRVLQFGEGNFLRTFVDEMIDIAKREIVNAEDTIPIVQVDSRLGWEPSMEYIGSEYHLRWKIRQLTQVLEQEIPRYERGLQSILEKTGKY